MAPTSPVPAGVAEELQRVVRRWQQLPLDHALTRVPGVRLLLEDLAARTAPGDAVPDLGPAVVMDQLAVLVYDACREGVADGLEQRLAALRTEIS